MASSNRNRRKNEIQDEEIREIAKKFKNTPFRVLEEKDVINKKFKLVGESGKTYNMKIEDENTIKMTNHPANNKAPDVIQSIFIELEYKIIGTTRMERA